MATFNGKGTSFERDAHRISTISTNAIPLQPRHAIDYFIMLGVIHNKYVGLLKYFWGPLILYFLSRFYAGLLNLTLDPN